MMGKTRWAVLAAGLACVDRHAGHAGLSTVLGCIAAFAPMVGAFCRYRQCVSDQVKYGIKMKRCRQYFGDEPPGGKRSLIVDAELQALRLAADCRLSTRAFIGALNGHLRRPARHLSALCLPGETLLTHAYGDHHEFSASLWNDGCRSASAGTAFCRRPYRCEYRPAGWRYAVLPFALESVVLITPVKKCALQYAAHALARGLTRAWLHRSGNRH